MSFGFSVSDFLIVVELASKIRKKFVGAPSQFNDIYNEVKNLSNIIRDIEDFLPERELTSQQITDLQDIAGGCRNVLSALEETLNKYQELKNTPEDIGKKAQRAWKRLKWEPEDIKELRSRVVSNIVLFNTFQGKLASQISLSIKEGVDRLHERQDHRESREEREAILEWLTPIEYATQQSDFISRRQKGTGQGLLNSDKFRQWVDKNNQTLFCPGIPGAGKTISAAIVVDELDSEFSNDPSVGVSYVYCNFRRQYNQKPIDLLASLLKQMVQGLSSVPESTKSLYERCQHRQTRPSTDEVSQILQSVVRAYSKVFIIVDALDECQVSDGARKKFVTDLFELQTKTSANLFVTSRFILEIEKMFEGRSTKLEIRASDEDLQRYVNGHLLKLPSFVLRSSDLQREINTAIINATDGMFLLAQLHLDSLVGKRSPKAVRSALEKLPNGFEAYDQAYCEAMERIEGQVEASEILAKQVLLWITCAKRPLTILELRHALAVEIGESGFDNENLSEIKDIVSVCAGLVTVDEESNIIRLVHYTTQEFFERTREKWFPKAEIDIANICITYLSFDIFGSGFCQSDQEFETRLQSNPLYSYAAQNWGHHLRESNGKRPNMEFLDSESKVSAANQAMIINNQYRHSDYSQNVPGQMRSIHLMAWFGLTEILSTSLGKGDYPDYKDSYGRTPLSYAAENGHGAVVKLLLAPPADININSQNRFGQTPLSYAAQNGHEAVVKLLLARADIEVNLKNIFGQTALLFAAENGHEAVVELLLARADVEVDIKSISRRTPLSYAAENGHEAVVKLLLARADIEVNLKDIFGQTALLYAAENGHEAVVRMLKSKNSP